ENPENTMRSFRSAIDVGCDLIECDVHLSADGRLVVIHNHTLERTTNGAGLVRDHSAAELRKLDAGEGEKIPLLQEVGQLALGKGGLAIEVHSAGGAVGVWPMDDDTAVQWCKYCKPDSVFSNRPREVGAALRQ